MSQQIMEVHTTASQASQKSQEDLKNDYEQLQSKLNDVLERNTELEKEIKSQKKQLRLA